MYSDCVFVWNFAKGCEFDCIYCRKSFQKINKRFMPKFEDRICPSCKGFGCGLCSNEGHFSVKIRGCQDCYDYKPHLHPDRLNINFNLKKYETIGDQFIWGASHGDIFFMKQKWINMGLEVMRKFPNRTFFMQSKQPICFTYYDLPDNLIIGTTIETNRGEGYENISKAPKPHDRGIVFMSLKHHRKSITIEPILEFDLEVFVNLIELIKEENGIERIYIGYDTKRTGLAQPSLEKTMNFIKKLRVLGLNVKEKSLKVM